MNTNRFFIGGRRLLYNIFRHAVLRPFDLLLFGGAGLLWRTPEEWDKLFATMPTAITGDMVHKAEFTQILDSNDLETTVDLDFGFYLPNGITSSELIPCFYGYQSHGVEAFRP